MFLLGSRSFRRPGGYTLERDGHIHSDGRSDNGRSDPCLRSPIWPDDADGRDYGRACFGSGPRLPRYVHMPSLTRITQRESSRGVRPAIRRLGASSFCLAAGLACSTEAPLITLHVTDARGVTASDTVEIAVRDTTTPTALLPVAGGRIRTVSADVADAVGVASVQFFVDGVAISTPFG